MTDVWINPPPEVMPDGDQDDDPEATAADFWVDEARNETGRVWPGDDQEDPT
ncbi:MAG TPA: hypothetical protein VGG68_00900 [Caulobacteraceae bacterium]|jgi:hypothetical protein